MAVADPIVTALISAFELMRRLSVDPAPRPMLRKERVARAFNARSPPRFGTVMSKLVINHAARGSSCARVTVEKAKPQKRQIEKRNRIIFIGDRSRYGALDIDGSSLVRPTHSTCILQLSVLNSAFSGSARVCRASSRAKEPFDPEATCSVRLTARVPVRRGPP